MFYLKMILLTDYMLYRCFRMLSSSFLLMSPNSGGHRWGVEYGVSYLSNGSCHQFAIWPFTHYPPWEGERHMAGRAPRPLISVSWLYVYSQLRVIGCHPHNLSWVECSGCMAYITITPLTYVVVKQACLPIWKIINSPIVSLTYALNVIGW